jgi:hypothetical protein
MNVSYNGKRYALPDFLIVGAARAGTTTLYQHLLTHPQLFLPRVKEPSFFHFLNNANGQAATHNRQYITTLSDYAQLFAGAPKGAFLGEASTVYLHDAQRVIRNISEIYSDRTRHLRIVVILREPVERALSMYSHMAQCGMESMPFDEAIKPEIAFDRVTKHGKGFDYIGGSRYLDPITRYLDSFENVKILMFDDLSANRSEILADLCEFLSVDPSLLRDNTVIANASGKVRNSLWGKLFLMKRAISASPAKPVLDKLIPHVLSRRLGALIHHKGIQKDARNMREYRGELGFLFTDDLRGLAALFEARGMPGHVGTVGRWLMSYETSKRADAG